MSNGEENTKHKSSELYFVDRGCVKLFVNSVCRNGV
uniref:Uncharacterized protein n=1 Tax=Anguilla anguilla TaxID=7936 RepID=A0A0E9TQ17_ANGAN